MIKLFSNRRSLLLIIVLLIFVGLLILLGFKYKNNFSSKADTVASSVPVFKTEFVNNQILVKFKPEALAKIQSQNPATRSSDKPSFIANNTGIDGLNKIDSRFKAIKISKAVESSSGTRGMSSNKDIDRWYVIKYDLPTKTIKGDLRKTNFAGSVDQKITYANLIKSYQNIDGIEAVEPNYINQADTLTNDSFLSSQTFVKGVDDLYGLKKIGAPQVWDKTTGKNMVVAVVDTGVDYNHPDLKDNILRDSSKQIIGYDFINSDSDPMDDNGHGSHISGTIAAIGNNDLDHNVDSGTKLVGVGPNLKIMPIKSLNEDGAGSTLNCTNGIKFAVDHGAKVVNNSWSSSSAQTTIERDAIKYAYDKGVILVFASGNNGNDIAKTSDAGDPRVITVGSSDSIDKKAISSNFGVGLDFMAPGVKILSVKNESLLCQETGLGSIRAASGCVTNPDYYAIKSGTSMAAPHVSASVALILSLHPDWSIEEVRFALRNTADKIDKVDWDSSTGFGRINLANAVGLSTPPPVAFLDIPKNTILTSSYLINGVVSANSGVDKWSLSYGFSNNPTSWTGIANGSKAVNGLLGKLNPYNSKSEVVTLKLEVKDKIGKTSVTYGSVKPGLFGAEVYDPNS